jgi:pimeloyl-ACP methyl ester carboxylesterase
MWRDVLVHLPATLRPVVAQAHQDASLHTIEAFAARLLDEHAGELVLVGASMGGMIAMEAARQAPHRVQGLALLGTTARPETADMRALREAAIELFAQGRVREVIEPNVAMAFHPLHAARPELVQAYLELVLDAGAAQLTRQNRAVIQRPDARVHLPQCACAVLVVCGEADQLTPPECSREIAALVPGAEFAVLADCGHMLTMERPQPVGDLLRQWMARQGWLDEASTAL